MTSKQKDRLAIILGMVFAAITVLIVKLYEIYIDDSFDTFKDIGAMVALSSAFGFVIARVSLAFIYKDKSKGVDKKESS